MNFSPVYKKLTKEDADMCRAFKAIIHQGGFTMKGDVIIQCGTLFTWFQDLDKRIEETIKPLPLPEEKVEKAKK